MSLKCAIKHIKFPSCNLTISTADESCVCSEDAVRDRLINMSARLLGVVGWVRQQLTTSTCMTKFMQLKRLGLQFSGSQPLSHHL